MESSQATPNAAPTSRRRRRRLWPWLVGLPLALLPVVGIGSWIYLSRMVDRRLAEAIAAADRDDPHWQVDDLMAHREQVSDDENSAIVVSKALELLPKNWPSSPPPSPGKPLPPRRDIEDVFERLGLPADHVRLDEKSVQVLRAELDSHQEAVKIARTVANYPRGRHEVVLGPTLIDTLLPETQAARTAARLLQADSARRAHDGDLDGALDSCRAILCVGRSIGDEPFLISMLVRIAVGVVATDSVKRALALGEPSDEALARLQALMLDELDQPLLIRGMEGERAIMAELIRRVGEGEIPVDALSGSRPNSASPRPVVSTFGKLSYTNQRAVAIEWMNEAVAIARRPAHERPALWDAWQAEVDRVRKSRLGPLTATIPLLMSPAVAAPTSAHSRYQGELGSTILLLAAERHRRKTGQWPATLSAIDPAILPKQPIDPFSGEPFRMKHVDGRLSIYSIGPNLKDEGGAYEPKKWNTGTLDDVGAVGWDVARRNQPAAP